MDLTYKSIFYGKTKFKKRYTLNLMRIDSKTNFLALAVKLQFERSSKEPDIRNTYCRVFTNVYDVNLFCRMSFEIAIFSDTIALDNQNTTVK